MKKFIKQHWYSAIEFRYYEHLLDQRIESQGFYNFYANRLKKTSYLLKQECYYSVFKTIQYSEKISAPFLYKLLINLELYTISKLENNFFKIIRFIFDMITCLVLSALILFLLILLILSIPIFICKKFNNDKINSYDDIYYMDRNTAIHPLLREREFIEFTSLSKNFFDINVEKSFSIIDCFSLLDVLNNFSHKQIWRVLNIFINLCIASPIVYIPKHIKSLKSFLFLSTLDSRNKQNFKRVICVMTRADLGVGLFCEIKNLENVFVYLSSTELTVPHKYFTKGYLTTIDYAFMSCTKVICDLPSKVNLSAQKNPDVKYEVLESISKFHVNNLRNKLIKLISEFNNSNIKVLSFFNSSFGEVGTISDTANENFKKFSSFNIQKYMKKNLSLILITKFKSSFEKILIRGYNVPKHILKKCENYLSNSFDIIAISDIVISVPGSSITFQAAQSDCKVMIYDFEGENDKLRPLENKCCFARVTKFKDVIRKINLMV